ncbi:hypothetical protein WICMUC_000733 [Wickerhamomyces mucosus]|uniref:Sister chromatid cohesion protein DCC1 n=1 Tax=Wickerhamomyces mucosus TaxID=1378264 RepID=A0A9P8PY54_9ASCO|nr:hypothetical protein WICMUC_000733 [Wickerhamomyces mucosus]
MTLSNYDIVADVQLDNSYKVIELPIEILNILQDGKEELLQIKSLDENSDIVLCSENKTYQIKQRNHSNTVLVMSNDNDDVLYGFTKLNSVFECHEIEGSIDINNIQIYNGQDIDKSQNNIEILKLNSLISKNQFDLKWNELNGSSIDEIPIILSKNFITKSLHILIMNLLANNYSIDNDKFSLIQCFNLIKFDLNPISIDIVKTILIKFSSINQDKELIFQLNKLKISKWYGIISLEKYCFNNSIPINEFLINWKSEFPPFCPSLIDLNLLKGSYFISSRDEIRYISSNLPPNINDRLNYLFNLQKNWDLIDLIPFIEEFNTKNINFEKFIVKFAKRQKIGTNKFIISSR